MPSDLMNRFGGQRMQAPLAPMPQQKPGMLEQIGTGIAMDAGTDIAKDVTQPYVDQLKTGASDALTSAQGAFGNALGLGAEAGSGMEAAMFEAAPFEAIGAEGISATTGLGEALAGEAVAGEAAAGALGGAGAGMAAAMPWIGAGLLAGKAFGLFSKGGPVYAECGGKMPKYRAEGGYTYDQYKKDKEQEDYNKGSYGAFYAANGGMMGALPMAINKYHDKLQNDPLALSPAAALFRNEGSYMPEQPTGEELKALEEQMKKRMMIEQMYENNRRAQEEAGEMMPEMEGYGPLRYYRFEKGGKVDAVKADIQNEDMISKMGIDQFGEQANMIRKQNLWSNEEMYGPVKSIKYKSAGGDVYSKEYDTKYRFWGSDEPETNYQSAQQLRGNRPTKPYMDPEGAREREIAAEQARASAEAIGTQMPGALGGMADYLARRRKHMEEMNKLLGK